MYHLPVEGCTYRNMNTELYRIIQNYCIQNYTDFKWSLGKKKYSTWFTTFTLYNLAPLYINCMFFYFVIFFNSMCVCRSCVGHVMDSTGCLNFWDEQNINQSINRPTIRLHTLPCAYSTWEALSRESSSKIPHPQCRRVQAWTMTRHEHESLSQTPNDRKSCVGWSWVAKALATL